MNRFYWRTIHTKSPVIRWIKQFAGVVKYRASDRVPFWQCAVLFLLSVALSQQIILSLIGQENEKKIVLFGVYAFFIIFLETGICCFLAWCYGRAEGFVKGLIGESYATIFCVIGMFNAMGLWLSYTVFAAYPLFDRLLILVMGWLLIRGVLILNSRVLFIGMTLLGISVNVELGVQVWQKTVPPELSLNWREDFEQEYGRPTFVHKPNVYVISWDALSPAGVMEEYMDIEREELGYVNFLDNSDMRLFRNIFTDRAQHPLLEREMDPSFNDGSRVFHNSMLFLDPNLWEVHDKGLKHYYGGALHTGKIGYFAGRVPAPLYEIFKENGYKVMASYQNEHFGKKGAYIDQYMIPGKWYAEEGQCAYGLEWYHFQSLGFCEFDRDTRVEFRMGSAPNHVVKMTIAIAEKAQEEVPWLVMANISSPSHTAQNYLHEPEQKRAFRKEFTESSQRTGGYMRDIMDTIKSHDPDAILFFVGDHGPRLLINMDKSELDNKEARRFYFLDSHAIMGALYPADACAEYMQFDEKYLTFSMLLRALVICLSEGEDPIDWEVDYSSPYEGVRFEDYLYE